MGNCDHCKRHVSIFTLHRDRLTTGTRQPPETNSRRKGMLLPGMTSTYRNRPQRTTPDCNRLEGSVRLRVTVSVRFVARHGPLQ